MNNYLDYIDNTFNPGDNFFMYATGHWIDHNPQPLEYPRWNTFAKLSDENIKKIEKIIKHPGNTEIGNKLKTYYNIVSNWEKRNEDGIIPLKRYLCKNLYSLFTKDEIFEFIAKEHIPIFFNVFVCPDFKNPNMNVLWEWESGLTIGNRDYYLVKTDANKKILKAFKKYVINVYKMIGKTDEAAKEKFKMIFKIEKQIAKVYTSEEEQQDPSKNYHKKNIEKLSKTINFDLNRYLCLYGYNASSDIIVGQEKHFKYVCKLFNSLSVEELKTIVEWNIISSYINTLDDSAHKIVFKFNQAFTGAKKDKPRKKRAITKVNSVFNDIIGQIYVEKYFSQEAKEDVKNLIEKLIVSFKNILSENDWMSDNTRKLAFEKLNKMRFKIGYPDKFEDYSNIPIDENLTLFENSINIEKYFFNKHLEKHYNKPVDKDEWHCSPHTVNAYYDETQNEICFPAGILQGDFYEYGRDIALNYGAIGVVIGHEMTHGFDNHGRQFDANGNMCQWWTNEEIEKFNKLTENTIKHFNNLDVLPDMKANGTLTLGENLADYGGLKIAFNALKSIDDSNETLKKFFISNAITWAGVNTEESIRTQTITNEHSVNFNRINGTFAMFTPWYEVFGITKKDKLYIPENERAKIW